MGFRFRKSIKLGKSFRINLSKSGVGWSMGTKAFRYTKKAGGGSRTTSTIPGTGISYVKEYGKSKAGKDKSAAGPVASSPTKSTVIAVTVIIFLVLLSINAYVALGCLVGLAVTYACIVIRAKKNGEPSPFATDNASPDGITEDDLLELQKILFKGSPDTLIMSRAEIYDQLQWQLSNGMRIIDESANIIESTRDIDTFFSRADLILEKYEYFKRFELYVPFGEYTASEAYDQAKSELVAALERFIYRHVDGMTLDAMKLKTEKGKQNRYEKSFESFKKYYDRIDPSNWQLIENEFKRLIK